MRASAALAFAFVLVTGAAPTHASGCPGNPDALGTSRVLVVDPSVHRQLGSIQYQETLPLARREVVLTFDDGPLPPYTQRVLDTLAAECVRATFFVVGSMVRRNPDLARKIAAAGHTIGTHTERHPYRIDLFTPARAEDEIEDGIAAAAAVLGGADRVAPFFRFPGLRQTAHLDSYLGARAIMTWSADVVGDDWRGISAQEVINRTLRRLEARGRGIVLLHDIQPVTALALPELLRQLKARGFRVVHVVPAKPGQTVTATLPEQWRARGAGRVRTAQIWPRAPEPFATAAQTALAAPTPASLGVADAAQTQSAIHSAMTARRGRRAVVPAWPQAVDMPPQDAEAALPAPAAEQFHYVEIVHPTATVLKLRLALHDSTPARRPHRPAPTRSTPAPQPHINLHGFLSRLFGGEERAPEGRAKTSRLHQ